MRIGDYTEISIIIAFLSYIVYRILYIVSY